MPPFHHIPVLRDEVVAWFAPVPAGLIVDATVGGGGHAEALLQARTDIAVLGLDRDLSAVAAANARLAPFAERAIVRHARFDRLAEEVRALGDLNFAVSGVLFDLGVSSVQLDQSDRGFSYRTSAPLDMRMDPTVGRTAAHIVASASVTELADLLRRHGDERFAGRIAKAIVAARQDAPITTTVQLAQIVTAAIPAATRRTGGHPAKRTFQALRIEVNDELGLLGPAVESAIDVLADEGRCVVLSYHSGEDRIVKERFRVAETGGCICPVGLPCVCGALPRGRAVRKSVTRPSATEIEQNPRAESALARVFERRASPASPESVQ